MLKLLVFLMKTMKEVIISDKNNLMSCATFTSSTDSEYLLNNLKTASAAIAAGNLNGTLFHKMRDIFLLFATRLHWKSSWSVAGFLQIRFALV